MAHENTSVQVSVHPVDHSDHNSTPNTATAPATVTGNNSLTLGLALLGGLGVTLMIVALAAGVVGAEGGTVGLLLLAGLAMLIGAAVAWGAVVQPWTHFDNINLPAEDDHHGGTDHDHDEHAVVVYEASAPQPHH
ncbi:MAG: hypothetical protein SF029_11155 [bacterium]|nr:hypothetical protein [bacterium]